MNRLIRLCFFALVALGLFLPACDKLSGGGSKEKKEEKETKEKKAEQEAEEKEKAKEEAKKEEADAGEISREDYVKASAELACIDTKLGDADLEQEKVKTNVLGKYGFDGETYEKADEKFSDKEEVTSAIDEALDDCTEETAKQYAGMTEGEEEKPKPKPKRTGTFNDAFSGEMGFDSAKLKLTITEDFEAFGTFRGSREGKGFRIPFKGSVSKSNEISASGSEGKNSVSIDGGVHSGGAKVELSGKVWERTYTITMNAN